MAVSEKIFQALTSIVKTNEAINRITDDIKMLNRDVRDIDRRLIRVEALIEVAEKNNYINKLKSHHE